MQVSISNLTDNLSEINKNQSKSCKEQKKISVNCSFIKLKNNRLIYRCKKMWWYIQQTKKWINWKVFKYISALQ